MSNEVFNTNQHQDTLRIKFSCLEDVFGSLSHKLISLCRNSAPFSRGRFGGDFKSEWVVSSDSPTNQRLAQAFLSLACGGADSPTVIIDHLGQPFLGIILMVSLCCGIVIGWTIMSMVSQFRCLKRFSRILSAFF